jgi:hypothetical protein
MSTDATEADWQRVLFGLNSLWQGPRVAGRLTRIAGDSGRGRRAATHAIQEAAVRRIWQHEGAAARRRNRAAHGPAPAHRCGLAVREGFGTDAPPAPPTPARPLNS